MLKLDRIDYKILRILQRDARISNVDLSRRVNLSPAPCLSRVKKLEDQGYIVGYRAELDAVKLNLSLVVYVEITLDRTTLVAFDKFREDVQKISEIEECHMVAGGFDYLLKVRCSDMDAYRRLLCEKIALISGLSQTHTYVVIERVKDTSEINI